ncbi:sodium/glutamate symporter [Jeotgalicoccus halotolerans]|uniref:ESS family glutamate:Na+ symporter n=1 Tax=Jeotgalicoccus halotolerans TaxID=157227 RepID=A0A3E0B028_9STAP|nr:sodium/glutamate symporter [Jeotgalicoccus halotolerans]REG25318.1 ESS family glutamate:Na+ symporter [Jeotgalicoccus halotolerans]
MIPTDAIDSGILNSLLFYIMVMGLLLVVAVFIRIKLKVFKKYFIPASLIAGVLGIIFGPFGIGIFSEEMVSAWGALAGILISIVFAPMLLGVKKSENKGKSKLMIRHLIFSYTASLLQIGVPLLAASLLILPFFDVPEIFATIIEVGWAGGHGTAAGMFEVYDALGWDEGGSLAVTTATIGIVFGIVSGIIMINIAVKKGYSAVIKDQKDISTEDTEDIIPVDKQTANSVETVNPDMIESTAFHIGLIGIAIILGWFMQQVLNIFVTGIPLFPLAMIGGLIVNAVIMRTKYSITVDKKTLNRIQGVALDFLILGAVASIQIPVVVEFALPLIILTVVTVGLMMWYFYYLGPRFFPKEWFENAIVHYGAYSGVTAIGLMLLRTADPKMETEAGQGFALRAPLYSPFLGGGLLTAIIPLLVLNSSGVIIGLSALAIVAILLLISHSLGLVKLFGSRENFN